VRRLNRISRKLADYSTLLLRDDPASAREQPVAVPMTAGDVRFTMWLPAGRAKYPNYQRLSSTGKIYEPVMLGCLTRVLQQAPKSSFMDIGAYLGYYACYVSALFAGRQEVYAVESNPLYANALREAAPLNGFSQLRVFQVALSDRVEPVKIDGLAVCHNSDWAGATLSLTLDELCKRERLRPTIVKMDVHGAEGKIVLGMRRVLAHLECILLEMHPLSWLREYSPGVTRTAILDSLEEAGLTLYQVAGHTPHSGDSGDPLECAPDFRELLAGRGYCYRRLDRRVRDPMMFDRSQEIFVLGLRCDDVGSLLGPSIPPPND
jgi:FkbM family methyltransferase